MNNIKTVVKFELLRYFSSPLAYVYLVSFLNAKGEEIGSDKYYGSLADLVSPEGTKDTKITQYYEERKLCIIGSNTMDTPVRAT
jgi:ABC-type transport system involved in multi-copper enzyme maturation permease subunit